MKGVLSLCLAASALGFTDFLTSFHSGFKAGLSEASLCLDNPHSCGQDLSLLASAVRPAPARHLHLTLSTLDLTIHDIENFLAGLIAGLQVPDAPADACSNDFTTASYAIAQLLGAVLNDYNTRSFDFLQIINVGCAFLPVIYLPYESDCRFNALISALEHTTFETLVLNYVGNSCDINDAIADIVACSQSYQDCGFAIGTIVREEINWAI
jgi:hypothetical protein